MSELPGSISLRGRITSGLGRSRLFTSIPWVKEQFISRLGIDPSPGTLNLRIIDDDLPKLEWLKKQAGIHIAPLEPGFCSAMSFRVAINGKAVGAALFPEVENYPAWQMEIVAQKMLRKELSLKEGDEVMVEVFFE